MAHDLFSEISTPSVRVRSASRWTIVMSVAAHVAIVALVLIIPLMAADVLPIPDTGTLHFMPAVPTPPAPPAPRIASARATTPVNINPNVAPINPPDAIHDEVLPAATTATAIGGVDFAGVTNGVPDSVGTLGAPIAIVEPPPPPKPPAIVRVGGGIRPPARIHNVAAVYPSIAQQARISGTVIIDAIIDKDGSVRDARVLSGVPLLNEAALNAVRQWRYSPTLLNGEPVQVMMTVRVDFRLN